MTKLFVISGPSGVGKDSIIEGLRKELDFEFVISTTSRKKRKGERQGKPYYFVSKKRFEEMIKKDELLEWAIVYGNYYGSSKKTVLRLLKKNKPVILRIDPQGARTIKKMFKEAKVIFIVPPSIKILEKRLKKRGLDSNEVIKQRLIKAKEELTNLKQWDYVVENKENKLKETIKKVKKIILKEFQK